MTKTDKKYFELAMLKSYQLHIPLYLASVICMLAMQTPPNVHAVSNKTETIANKFPINQGKILGKTSCRIGTKTFELVLTSPSGDFTEDDTTLWFIQDAKAVKANPGKPGYIDFFPTNPKNTSICNNATSFLLSNGYIIFPLFLSNRPSLDFLAAVIYDPKENKVLKYEVLESYYGKTPKLVGLKNGFSYLAVSAQPNDGPKGLVETWLDVTWKNNQLTKKWDRSRPEVRH